MSLSGVARLSLVIAIAATGCAGAVDNATPPDPAPLWSPAPPRPAAPPRAAAVLPAPSDALRVPPPEPPEEVPPIRGITEWVGESDLPPPRRIEAASTRKLDVVKQLFAQAGVPFPPADVLLRGFKQDNRLEVWAAGSAGAVLTHVTTYEICYASGDLGPKRAEGDRQVPEGFYTISDFNPQTRFHLGMQVSYPNESDRILGSKKPGGEIMIHGKCLSIGCLAMTDERIEELWVIASAARYGGGRVHVHIFPARDMDDLLADRDHAQHWEFWRNLKEGLLAFERDKKLFVVQVDRSGRYAFR